MISKAAIKSTSNSGFKFNCDVLRNIHASGIYSAIDKSHLPPTSNAKGSTSRDLHSSENVRKNPVITLRLKPSQHISLVQGLQGRESQFDTHSRCLSCANITNVEQSQGVRVPSEYRYSERMEVLVTSGAKDVYYIVSNPISGNDYVNAYNMGSTVSLHSTMQSNVPKPFVASTRGLPSYLNMPGGGFSLRNKYTATEQIDAQQIHRHYKKNYSTLSTYHFHTVFCPKKYISVQLGQESAPVEEDPGIKDIQVILIQSSKSIFVCL